jgi:hypothetical protein
MRSEFLEAMELEHRKFAKKSKNLEEFILVVPEDIGFE